VAHLRCTDLHVRFPDTDVEALAGVDLDVPEGGRLVLVGASGSGKSSLLRAIAGALPVASGRIRFDERDVTHLPSRDRDVAMVHQTGTLQPHLNVRRNLGFRLRLRGTPRAEERQRVRAEARAFELTELLGRRPATLSTGERHEVALARTLVRRCAVLLLDEPFARVDAHRVATLRRELLAVQQGYGVTTVLATNDAVTAHAFGEQVAVLHAGRVVQSGAPQAVADAPASTQVAELLVVPPVNLIPGAVERRAAGDVLLAGPLRIPLRRPLPARRVTVGLRPRDLRLTEHGVPVPIRHRAVLGDEVELAVGRAGDPPLRVLTGREAPPVGTSVGLRVDPARVHVFDATSGSALRHGL
jgi:multiple sugar transport system ATP-binding protein